MFTEEQITNWKKELDQTQIVSKMLPVIKEEKEILICKCLFNCDGDDSFIRHKD